MKLETYIPTAALMPFVKCYIIVDCDETTTNTMLPDTSIIMGFRYKGATKYINNDTGTILPFAVVAGLRNSIQLMQDIDDTSNLLVIFNTAGANAFLKEPLYQLFGEVAPLRDMSDYNDLNEIEDKLCNAKTDLQRINIIEQFLISKLYNYHTDPLLKKALHLINDTKGLIKIKDLANELFISIDAFEKRFRNRVGASPKQICKTTRMISAINSLQNSTLTETALDTGYYDQAHFNKDFKLFTGQTPTEFLKKEAH